MIEIATWCVIFIVAAAISGALAWLAMVIAGEPGASSWFAFLIVPGVTVFWQFVSGLMSAAGGSALAPFNWLHPMILGGLFPGVLLAGLLAFMRWGPTLTSR